MVQKPETELYLFSTLAKVVWKKRFPHVLINRGLAPYGVSSHNCPCYNETRQYWLWYVLTALKLFILHEVQCRYNAVNFLPNPHKIQPISRPSGRDMGCNLWFDTLIYILHQSTQCCIKYRVILNRVIMWLDCKSHSIGMVLFWFRLVMLPDLNWFMSTIYPCFMVVLCISEFVRLSKI